MTKSKKVYLRKLNIITKEIETFKSTITGIEKRKEELNTLIDESKKSFP